MPGFQFFLYMCTVHVYSTCVQYMCTVASLGIDEIEKLVIIMKKGKIIEKTVFCSTLTKYKNGRKGGAPLFQFEEDLVLCQFFK